MDSEWCDRVRKFERSVILKPVMQFGKRCHWLEAERITHKYDPQWGTGVWLGRYSATDAHLIGTPGGVIQVRTVRRLTHEQRGDDVNKRAFDNFIGSPRNLLGSKPSLEEQTAHGKNCVSPRLTPREILQVQQNLQVQRDLLDLHERKERNVNLWTSAAGTETPDAETTRRTRIVTKRSDPGNHISVVDRKFSFSTPNFSWIKVAPSSPGLAHQRRFLHCAHSFPCAVHPFLRRSCL